MHDETARARLAVFAVFALNGAGFATWAARIPDVKAGLGLTAGQLGIVLLFLSVGSLAGLPLSGRIADRIGPAATVRFGGAVWTVGLLVAALGVTVFASPTVLAVGLAAVGFGVGVWDVSMNLEGAAVERRLGRAIMPHFHAAFSAGTVASTLVAAALSWAGVSVGVHFAVGGVLIAAGMLVAVRGFLGRDGDELTPEDPGAPAPVAPRSAWLEPRTLLIGLVALVAAFTEGTANDWIAVAFVDGHGLPPWAGVLAFATFLGAMTTGRLIGTALLDRFGRVPVLRALLVMAAVGTLLVVFGSPALAYVGAAIWGLGTALGFPVGMSAAADDESRAAARVSVVATIGYAAFLAGPPLLGFLGDHHGVLRALLAVGALIVPALLVLPAVREPASAALDPESSGRIVH
ncbi:MFS transporter [Janibacter sp. G1551]|uniref:MFS transporter n=1 Tax=Janibacter sp. G1551 TaxID=3420440 RepID=UPI003CFEED92